MISVHRYIMHYITHMSFEMPAGLDMTDADAVHAWVVKTARQHKGETGTRRRLALLTGMSESTIKSWVSGRRKNGGTAGSSVNHSKGIQDKRPPGEPGSRPRITWDDMPDVVLAMTQAVTTVVSVTLRSLRRVEKAALDSEASRLAAVTPKEERHHAMLQGGWEAQLARTGASVSGSATGLLRTVIPAQAGQGADGTLAQQIAEYQEELSDE